MATMWVLQVLFFPVFVPQMKFFCLICCKCHLILITFHESNIVGVSMKYLFEFSLVEVEAEEEEGAKEGVESQDLNPQHLPNHSHQVI